MATNRKQRRHEKKHAGDTFTRTQAKQAASVTAKIVMDRAITDYSAAVMLCLHDKLGFGPVRAQRFIKDVEELFDSINKGYLTIEDAKQTIREELGIDIK